ncbi:MAG: YceD family protein [Ilumatobacteraceae bacterium]
MATPLVVNVVELLRWPGTTKDLTVTVAAEDLEFNDARITTEPVDIAVHLESLSNGVSVSGSASATWQGECRRCLAPLSERMVVHVSEMYQQIPEDPEAYSIDNDQINLLPMVRENLLLAVPLGPLCREDCPGFCPVCGNDLSETECGCDNTVTDPRWAGLESLKGQLPDPPP